MIVATSGVSTSADWVTLKEPGESVARLGPGQDQKRRELKALDRNVQEHEQAHMVAGGSLVRGAAQYRYTIGPDGKFYATGGAVEIDTAEVHGDPRATYEKAKKVEKTANAPDAADLSTQDRYVSAHARAMAHKAYSQMGSAQNRYGATSESTSVANLLI